MHIITTSRLLDLIRNAKKSLQIPKWLSETVNWRRSDNTTTKKDKGKNKDLQKIAQKTRNRAKRTQIKTKGELRCFGRTTTVPGAPHMSGRVGRYQMGNQNPSIEGQTTQWPKEKGQTMIYEKIHIKLKIEQHDPH